MRKDMTKRFLEPCRGPKTKFPRHCKQMNLTDEDGNYLNNPHGMKQIHRMTPKCSDDYGEVGTDLRVLRRFLQSRVGQPWDKVYSEICAEADQRSFPGHHLREWLDFEVEQNCTLSEDGEVLDERGRRVDNTYWMEEYYVHPATGILEHNSKRKWKREPLPQTVFEVDDQHYHQHEGIWYRVRMREVEGQKHRIRHYYWNWNCEKDVFIGKEIGYAVWFWRVTNMLEQKYGKSPNDKLWYCVWKQSANSKEIAKLKKIKQAA